MNFNEKIDFIHKHWKILREYNFINVWKDRSISDSGDILTITKTNKYSSLE